MNTKSPLDRFMSDSMASVIIKFAIILSAFLLAACMQSHEYLFY